MLCSLSIRNVVVIDSLDLDLGPGLSVFTGETGAGKSILLNALGLVLGLRAEGRLHRNGADDAPAVVSAVFELGQNHPTRGLLAEQGLEVDKLENNLIMRRSFQQGRSRSFVNDHATSTTLLRALGTQLVEIDGQFAAHGLLNPARHLALLDQFAGHSDLLSEVGQAHLRWRDKVKQMAQIRSDWKKSADDQQELSDLCDQIEQLDPQDREIVRLEEKKRLLQARESIIHDLSALIDHLGGDEGKGIPGANMALLVCQRHLARLVSHMAPEMEPLQGVGQQALDAAEELLSRAQGMLRDMEGDEGSLDAVTERLFTLKALARRCGVEVDQLADFCRRSRGRLDDMAQFNTNLTKIEADLEDDFQSYQASMLRLRQSRLEAAIAFDQEVHNQLPDLLLNKASFYTSITDRDEAEYNAQGSDRVHFMVRTHPSLAYDRLDKIASGGELARFMLALRAAVSHHGSGQVAQDIGATTLVFDEVDNGIGGAAAAAVGARLASIAETRQVLVVTHSPQVAAMASHHFKVEKLADGNQPRASVRQLDDDARREEIARMLAGAQITDEARQAADRLLEM